MLARALLLTVAMYSGGVLLPYYADDLHRLPLAEVASGGHDPKDLWPQNALVHLAGVCGLLLLPFMALVGAGLGARSPAVLWRHPASQRILESLTLLMGMAASIAAPRFQVSDLGAALTVWRTD